MSNISKSDIKKWRKKIISVERTLMEISTSMDRRYKPELTTPIALIDDIICDIPGIDRTLKEMLDSNETQAKINPHR